MAASVNDGRDDRLEERRRQREVAQRRAERREIERQRRELAEKEGVSPSEGTIVTEEGDVEVHPEIRARRELTEQVDGVDLDYREDVVVQDDEVRLTEDAEERVARHRIEQMQDELEHPDDVFVPLEGSAPVLDIYRRELESGRIEGVSRVDATLEGREAVGSPVEALERTDPERFDEFWGDTLNVDAEQRVEEELEAIERRRQLAEEDPVAFLEGVREHEDQFVERATPLEESLHVGGQRRDAARQREEAIAEEIARDPSVRVDDVDVHVDPAGRSDPDVELRSGARERIAEEQAQALSEDHDAAVPASAVDVEFEGGEQRIQVDGDAVREHQIEEFRREQADAYGVQPAELEQIETDDGVAFRPTGVVDPDEIDDEFLDDLLAGADEIEADDVEAIDFGSDEPRLELTDEATQALTRVDEPPQSFQQPVVGEFAQRSLGPALSQLYGEPVATLEEEELEALQEEAAAGTGLDPDQFVPTFQHGTPGVRPTQEAQEELLREQFADEEDVDPDDVAIETVDGELRVEIDEERGTWVGRTLESWSDTWQSGAERAGDAVRSRVPGEVEVTLATTPTFAGDPVPITTEEALGDIAGGAVESGISVLDPAGLALSVGDAGRWTIEENIDWRRAQFEAAQDLATMDYDEFRDDPVRAGALGFEAATGAQHAGGRVRSGGEYAFETGLEWTESALESTIRDDGDFQPLEASASAGAAIGAGVGVPGAAARGARVFRARPRHRRSFARDDRGQMELTIQRERQRDLPDEAFEPADPTARTPEGRAPPREAFPSDEAYQQALRRREEEILREQVEQAGPQVDPDASPVERIRQMRDEFGSWDEYQRELQRARELEQRQQLQQTRQQTRQQTEVRTPYGDPGALETTTADAVVDPAAQQRAATVYGDPGAAAEMLATDEYADPAGDLDLETAFADPAALETETAVDTMADAELDLEAPFADPTVDEDVTVDPTTDLETTLDQTVTQTVGLDTTLATDQPTVMDQQLTTAVDQPTATRTAVRPPARPAPRRTPFPEWGDQGPAPSETGDAWFDTDAAEFDVPIAEAEDLPEGQAIFGSDDTTGDVSLESDPVDDWIGGDRTDGDDVSDLWGWP